MDKDNGEESIVVDQFECKLTRYPIDIPDNQGGSRVFDVNLEKIFTDDVQPR
jgi:hypothetical protein